MRVFFFDAERLKKKTLILPTLRAGPLLLPQRREKAKKGAGSILPTPS